MTGFKITVNGKTYCESADVSTVTMVAEERPRRGGCRISLHAGSADAAMQWLAADMKVGDEIVIQVIEAPEPESEEQPESLGCSFCGRDAYDVSCLVRGPAAAICGECIRGFSMAVRGGAGLPAGAVIRDSPDAVCGFCSNRPGNVPGVPGVVVQNGAAVCPECLRACSDMLA